MGSRYYFDLEDGDEAIRDDIGVEASSLEQAVEVAREAFDEMRESGELPVGNWEMVVRDASGTLTRRLPVR